MSWKTFKEEFDTIPVYTRKQHAEALQECIKMNTVTRVIQMGKDSEIALNIVGTRHTPDGMIIFVK